MAECYGTGVGLHLFHYTFTAIDCWFAIDIYYFSYALPQHLSIHGMVTCSLHSISSLWFSFYDKCLSPKVVISTYLISP